MTIAGVIVPALFAGLVAIAVTVAIERFGGRVGGLLGTLPTTIVPAALGIYANSDNVDAFVQSMGAVPAGMLIDIWFLYLWRWLPPRLPLDGLGSRLSAMIVLSLLGWSAVAGIVVIGMDQLRSVGVDLLMVGVGVAVMSLIMGAAACLRAPPAPSGSRSVGLSTVLARGLLAAVAIGVAVTLAAVGGPLAAGMASVFPAIFLTTMVSLWLSQGEAVQAGAVGPMMLGASSVSAYALLCAWSLPALGAALGSAVAWVLAVVTVTVPAWWWLGRRTKTAPR
ncbi:MAG: hypothetical protein AAFV53_14230 [Myxococcota bacterium]